MNKITFPLKPGDKGSAVVDLQKALQAFIEKDSILRDKPEERKKLSDLLKAEREVQAYSKATSVLVQVFQKEYGIQQAEAVDQKTADAMNALLEKLKLLDQPDTPSTSRKIAGRIVYEYGAPAEGLKLRLYRLDFGGKATLLDDTSTLADGQYAFNYDLGGKAASIEVRAVSGENKEITLSKPLNDLSGESITTLNLVAPGSLKPLAAEYRRLTSDLKPHLGGMRLAEAKESNERQDLTVLNRATGWDARLIAVAVITERLSADPDVKLPQEAIYGLLRAGLPSDKLLLAQVEPDVVEQALKTVRDASIVELTDPQIGEFKQSFTAFSNTVRLNIPAPGSKSSYGDLLKSSGLPADAQAKFASVYINHRGDASQLWDKARKKGLDEVQISKLQLHGKLSFLAGSSHEMTSRLMDKGRGGKPLIDPAQLVELDFHRPEQWKAEVKTLAGNDEIKLAALIPVAYAGDKVEDRLDAYCEDMARKVRLSYPTQVVGRMIEKNEIKLPAAVDATSKLLKSAAGQGFRLGQTPVETFFKTRMTKAEYQAAQPQLQQMKTLQRVYQITPSNEAMPVLMNLGITSGFDLMAYSETNFNALYAAEYFKIYNKTPTEAESRLVYRKAKQVSSVTYNLFTIAKKFDSETQVAGLSAPVEVREEVRDEVRNELIKHFPTMESLFGSMDFCECEHCRSVLSPAAYLVDLLQFIDVEPDVWKNFLDEWEKTHPTEYKADWNQKPDGSARLVAERKPYDALIERRPDIPYIALTCENTHTALPYIDIVNEILEYYVANDKLAEDAAHDTGDATTAELLAEPQNVISEAYDKVRKARYPLNLPFDLWIDTVRQFCNYFEIPLARVLDVFRKSDDLFSPGQVFDRSSIFFESLGFSSAELAIFTDADPLGNDKWHELYGYPTARPAIQNSTNTGNATLTVANTDAKKFVPGFACTFFDVSANTLSDESKVISTIGASDSGGAGLTLITFSGVWTAPPDAADPFVCNASAMLSSAKTLSRRLGVTYKEIAEIVQTGFVNPKLTELVLLYKLGVSIHDARLYKDHKPLYVQNKDLIGKVRSELSPVDQLRFDELTKKVPNSQNTGWEIVNELGAFEQQLKEFSAAYNKPMVDLETYVENIPYNKILVLADPDAGCNFDLTTLQYADGKPVDPIALLRTNLFVRLWRKLGWSIEETDRALTTFIPRSAPFDGTAANLAKRPLKTALIYLAHLKALDEQVKVGKQSRLKLLTMWSDIATTGKKPLYAQLFLTRSILKSDPVFDDALGKYLTPTGLAAKKQAHKHEVWVDHVLAGDQINPADLNGQAKVKVFYDALQEVQHLSYVGELSDADKANLIALSTSPALPKLLDAVQVKAREYVLVKGHMLALQGALGLTTDEINRILVEAGSTLDTAELSLSNLSQLYRYGLLAKAIKLSVRELISLKQLSGIDPFKLLHSDPLTTLSEDYPFSQTLRFVEIAEEVKDSGLKIEDLEYLLRHHFDDTGKYRPNREGTLVLLKKLAEGVSAIRAEHAVPGNPGAMSEEVLRQKLGLALPPDTVERFLAMVNGKVEFTASKTGLNLADELKMSTFTDEERIRQLSYKEVPYKEQKLTFQGVLFDAQKTALQAKFAPALSPLQKLALAELLGDVMTLAREFFDNLLMKQKLRLDGEAGFLEDGDFDKLFRALKPYKPFKKILSTDTQQEINDKLLENEKIQLENEKIQNENLTDLQLRRYRIAQAFLPFLQQRLIRQLIVQTMTAHTGADPVLVESLTTDKRLLKSADSTPLLNVFSAIGERGITATYFFSGDQSGISLTTQLLADDYSVPAGTVSDPIRSTDANRAELVGYLEVPQDDAYVFSVVLAMKEGKAELRLGDPLKLEIQEVATQDGEEFSTAQINLVKGKRYPIKLLVEGNGARQVILLAKSNNLLKATYSSACLEGYLEVPNPGAYRFYVGLDKRNVETELRFPDLAHPVLLTGKALQDKDELGNGDKEFVELRQGIPYRFTLNIKKLNGGGAQLLVQGEALPKGSITQLTLYPMSAMAEAERSITLLTKVIQLVLNLGLSEREIRYLLMNAADFGDLDLSQLPTKLVADTPAEKVAATVRFSGFLRLAAYARLKRDFAAGTDDLIGIFEANASTATDKMDKEVYPLIAKLTRRDEAIVKATARALANAPAFASEKPLQRLWEALQVVERFGVPVPSLLEWTGIVSNASTPEQRFGIARDLKEAIKARFEPETWQRVAQPIFDKLRQRQRDVLVSHVMHQRNFDRMEQLYEYFLIDPGMEPVVQTSRIRLAIASLQLFIQRCLLNLELKVHPHPTVINSRQWEWMKRYRVWEANRKIFLFPENWLEPEFRDDKTHLFAQLEAALLQGDVSSDLVEDAFLSYLKKLDELARLDIVAMHIEDNSDPAWRTLHVIGRTYSQPHKYFYRRYAHQIWTPWEPVTTEIEGDHLAPVVWRDRLYLFWVTFMDKPDENASPGTTSGNTLADAKLLNVMNDLKEAGGKKQIDVQLHWSEYLNGEWSTRMSGGFAPVVKVVSVQLGIASENYR